MKNPERPYVVIYAAASVDGRISYGADYTMWDDLAAAEQFGGDGGVYKKIETQLKDMHQPGADILGSNSLVREGDELQPLPVFQGNPVQLFQDFLPKQATGQGHKGWLIGVDGRGRLRSGYQGDLDKGWPMLHLVSHAVSPDYLAFLQEQGISYLVTGKTRVDLTLALAKLKSKLGVKALISSAGGKLGGALLRAGLVDEVNILIEPRLMGGITLPCLFDSPDLEPGQPPVRLKLISCQTQTEGQVWLRYQLAN